MTFMMMMLIMMMMHCSREAKHRLEMDWSDKYSAQHLGKWRLIFCILYFAPRIQLFKDIHHASCIQYMKIHSRFKKCQSEEHSGKYSGLKSNQEYDITIIANNGDSPP